MTDILMIVLVALAGVLALVAGVFVVPFGAFFQIMLERRIKEAAQEYEQEQAEAQQQRIDDVREARKASQALLRKKCAS